MIRPLRKRHLQIWSVLLLVLPAVILFGRLAVPKQVSGTLLQQDAIRPLPVVLASVEREAYTVNLRTTPDRSQQQLEWTNKTTLTAPSALIYKLVPGDKQIIGRIESKGTSHFMLPVDSTTGTNVFMLYDFIHQQVIDTIKF